MDEHDQWIEGSENIAKAAVRHFQNMFTQDTHHSNFDSLDCIERCITEDDNTMLAAPPTMQEIKDCIFSIDIDSAPGPDGLSGLLWMISGTFSYSVFIHFVMANR